MIKNRITNIFVQIIRNVTIFNDFKRIIIPFRANLIYLSNSFVINNKKYYNIGDYLSKVVFEFLLIEKNIKNLWCWKTVRISFIGSIIQFLGSETIVYGSGFLFKWAAPRFIEKKVVLDIRAVRGPLTKKILENMGYKVPNVMGDPAILLPLFFFPDNIIKKYEFIVIPHFTQLSKYKNSGCNCVSTLTNNWKLFIETILSSKLVISSSLHGIIIAEAYGIPAIFLDDTEDKDQFKYDDYYYSTKRFNYIKCKSLHEALNTSPEKIPDFRKMQKDLIDAFPIDIFNK